MAQPILPGGILEVSLVGLHQAQRILTILHYRADPAIGSFPEFNTAASEFLDQLLVTGGVVETYLECLSEEYTFSAVRLQLIHPVRHAFKNFPQTGASGDVASPALPPNDGAMIVKRTDETGRHQRGAVHMPCVPTTFVDGGMLTTPAKVAYNAFGSAMVTNFVTMSGGGQTQWDPVIFNRLQPANSPVFTSATAEDTSRTNRRRTVGRGE